MAMRFGRFISLMLVSRNANVPMINSGSMMQKSHTLSERYVMPISFDISTNTCMQYSPKLSSAGFEKNDIIQLIYSIQISGTPSEESSLFVSSTSTKPSAKLATS